MTIELKNKWIKLSVCAHSSRLSPAQPLPCAGEYLHRCCNTALLLLLGLWLVPRHFLAWMSFHQLPWAAVFLNHVTTPSPSLCVFFFWWQRNGAVLRCLQPLFVLPSRAEPKPEARASPCSQMSTSELRPMAGFCSTNLLGVWQGSVSSGCAFICL